MKKRFYQQASFRFNVLFFATFLLFSALIVRLGVIQIVYGEDYQQEVAHTDDVIISTPSPRGKIRDRYNRIVVDNTPMHAITYTKTNIEKAEDTLEIAKKLAAYIEQPLDRITERDLQDYWLLTRKDRAGKKITDADKKKLEAQKLDKKDMNAKLYKLQVSRVTQAELKEITPAEMKIIAIKRELDSGYALTPQIVKNEGVTDAEYAKVSENLDELPGVNTTTDWERTYPYGDTLKSIIGQVTTSDKGLPQEQLEYFLSKGYSRNDRVGKSYLELQYDDVLRGLKSQTNNVTKKGAVIETEELTQGARGKDLQLTTDIELQKRLEKIIGDQLTYTRRQPGTKYFDRLFLVMTNPKTGEILSMVGKRYVTGKDGKTKMQDDALMTMTTGYAMGSAVKGATVLTGYQTGAIHQGSTWLDEVLHIKSTPTKSSVGGKGMGWVDDVTALKKSSNVYMFKTAMAIAGTSYRYMQPLSVKKQAFTTMRHYFSEFGLGVKTGIDLPGEIPGLQSSSVMPGHLLDLAIGQLDLYTPLQLSQYVSTIANDGYRMRLHMVKTISEPSIDGNGAVIDSIEPQVLNRIDMSEKEIKRVQTGFRKVTQESGGTAYKFFSKPPYNAYNVAGKTGTAEGFYDGPKWPKGTGKEPPETRNLTFVGYAPYDNPQIAFAVVAPWAYQSAGDRYSVNEVVGQQVLKAYFDLQNEYAKYGYDLSKVPKETVETKKEDAGT